MTAFIEEKETYDPTIQGLLSQCEDDWGDPIGNRKNLVPYGIKPLDKALFGIDIINGELIVIMGPQKQRKTTLVANILANIYTADKPEEKPLGVIDALESGMNPKRFRDALISIMATRYLIEQGHAPRLSCPECGIEECKEMGIYPEFLRYMTRSKIQLEAINYAIDTMMDWNLHIYGASPSQGNTRNLANSKKRWIYLVEELGAQLLVVDHIQQYSFAGDPSDYEKQVKSISQVSDVVAQYHIAALMLSQVSLKSLEKVQAGTGSLNATGGLKAQAEANVALSVEYESGSGQMKIAIEDTRKSDTFSFWHRLEDRSGNLYGEPSNEPFDVV